MIRPLLVVGFVGLAGLALVVPACGGSSAGNHGKLVEAARSYNDAIRWQNYSGAARWVPIARRQAFLSNRATEDMRVMEYAIREIRTQGTPPEQATVIVVVSWIRAADPTVQNTTRYQLWRYVQREGWRMLAETESDPDGPPPTE